MNEHEGQIKQKKCASGKFKSKRLKRYDTPTKKDLAPVTEKLDAMGCNRTERKENQNF